MSGEARGASGTTRSKDAVAHRWSMEGGAKKSRARGNGAAPWEGFEGDEGETRIGEERRCSPSLMVRRGRRGSNRASPGSMQAGVGGGGWEREAMGVDRASARASG